MKLRYFARSESDLTCPIIETFGETARSMFPRRPIRVCRHQPIVNRLGAARRGKCGSVKSRKLRLRSTLSSSRRRSRTNPWGLRACTGATSTSVHARDGGPVHAGGGGTFLSVPTLPRQHGETGKRNLCRGLGRFFHFPVSH